MHVQAQGKTWGERGEPRAGGSPAPTLLVSAGSPLPYTWGAEPRVPVRKAHRA